MTAPDAKGKFKSLSASGLATWMIKSRKGNLSRIISSLNQQVVFNRKKNPSYARKMKTTMNIFRKRLGKDKKKNALNFLKLYGDPFDQIFTDKQGTISINFGAYGVPETFLINEGNKVLKKYIGPLNDEDVYEIKNITNN